MVTRAGHKLSPSMRLCLARTRAWKELYKQRTSMERCNSRLKEHLTANRIQVSGIYKVKTHVYFNVIALLATALAVAKAKRNRLKKQISKILPVCPFIDICFT